MTRTHRFAAITVGVIVLTGAVGLGYWWGRSRDHAASVAPASATERKVLYWYDPMVPDQHFDKPGKSPFMDMQLQPKYADEAATGGVAIAPGVRQNLGIRTVRVKRGPLAVAVRVPGTIGWDLRQERIVSARVDAIVERLHVRAPFEPVSAGQPLASLIAPSWNTAIAEARALGEARSPAARGLQSAAQERLRALGLPPVSVAGQGGRITLTSPVTGVVSEIGVREGQSAPMGTLLFRINGTRTVWLEAAIPQAGIAGIKAGTPVEAVVDALPGETFHGRIETLLPQIDVSSRTQRARIVLDNPDGVLAPGMFAQIALQPSSGAEAVLVPSEALIGAGAQARVIVLGDDERFHPVRVEVGRSSGGMTEVLAGLKGGERVVASGQFLIDSEASLTGALERLGDMSESASPTASSSRLRGNDQQQQTRTQGREQQQKQQQQKQQQQSRTCPVQYWYDPMVPDQHFDRPGKSPYMDMQLVPKFAPDADADCTARDVEAEAQP